MRGFFLEKSWRASGTGTQTFNASSNYTIPYGKYVITVEGSGAPGNPNVVGNANYNPTSPGNQIYTPGYPGNYSYYAPPSVWDWPAGWQVNYGPIYNPGGPVYNPYTPPAATNSYNPPSPGNYASTNPTTPGNPGASASAFGITLPGGPAATPATYSAATPINYYAYPDSSAYPVSVSSGGYVTIKIL